MTIIDNTAENIKFLEAQLTKDLAKDCTSLYWWFCVLNYKTFFRLLLVHQLLSHLL